MKYIFLLLTLIFPVATFAAVSNIQEILIESVYLFNDLIRIVFGLALLVFFWGLAKFILKSGDEQSHADGRRLMIWGVIALFIMSSIWAILAVLQDDFGISNF